MASLLRLLLLLLLLLLMHKYAQMPQPQLLSHLVTYQRLTDPRFLWSK